MPLMKAKTDKYSIFLPDPHLGLLGCLVTVHPIIITEHYSGYLDLEDLTR
jgi:hypothetical protein